jgi:uncharacterized OsmC-like protein
MERIATALDRLHRALAARADFGRHTASSVATLSDGLRCSVTEQRWAVEFDLAPALGGDGSAPSPTVLARAALGACLAMGYQLRAAEAGVELSAVRVTVETDSELAGMLVDGAAVPPGFTAIRYHVDIESPASTETVERLVEQGDRLSPVLDMLTRANQVQRTVSVRQAVA